MALVTLNYSDRFQGRYVGSSLKIVISDLLRFNGFTWKWNELGIWKILKELLFSRLNFMILFVLTICMKFQGN